MRQTLRAWAKSLPPPGLLTLIYAVFITVGALILWLPISHNGAVGFGDALFTSASAVTVTGLVVVDTGTAFTLFGQMMIALLIQLGGLGLMAFAVLLLSALGVPIGLPSRMILREEVNQTSVSELGPLVRLIFAVALLTELVGAALLAVRFVPDHGLWQGIWDAVFHSISAFNNAGFSTFPNSLVDYAGDATVNIVIGAMFVLSGLGFVVISDVLRKRAWRPLALHSKLMLSGTVTLILFAWALFAILEWNNPQTLGALGAWEDRLLAAWFQAVTPRTAGFNSIDTGEMRDSAILLTIGLMIVGGGSASTAGGIKVTTAIVLLLGVIAFFQRSAQLKAFGRSIGMEEIQKVMALTTVSILLIFVALFSLTLTTQINFELALFEVASAFGTVGLSMGATGDLDGWGRAVIMVLMFAGRVGPLALGFFLATRSKPRVRYPSGRIYLG